MRDNAIRGPHSFGLLQALSFPAICEAVACSYRPDRRCTLTRRQSLHSTSQVFLQYPPRHGGGPPLTSVPVDAHLVLRQVLAETDDLLAQAELDLRRLEERTRLLQAERQGLRLALARCGGGGGLAFADASSQPVSSDEPTGAREPTPWLHLSRAEAVLETLIREGRPLPRLEIVELLAGAGRSNDDADAVSAALAYLRRTGRVQRAGSGQWVTSHRT